MNLPAHAVVSYRNSTSNHNRQWWISPKRKLYLIEILHQTTTDGSGTVDVLPLYLIEILHQTTTKHCGVRKTLRLYLIEILHQTTTLAAAMHADAQLYLIEILHQTTTMDDKECLRNRCILSKFYIKPQLENIDLMFQPVVSYRNSTSNHNLARQQVVDEVLYLIEILHQTTTYLPLLCAVLLLYLIEILHQTTTFPLRVLTRITLYLIEILHQTTTRGGRNRRYHKLYLIEILHQTTTRRHNNTRRK